jgi:deoxyhypusine synthase
MTHHDDIHHHPNRPANDQHDPTQSEYLSGEQILPRRVRPDMTVVELIDEQFQAYNAARLNECIPKRCSRPKKMSLWA